MDARRIELCERALERHIETLFDAAATLPGADNFVTAPSLELPYIGGLTFIAGHGPPELRRRVVRGLCAAWRFCQEAADWAPPLGWEDCTAAEAREA